LDSELVTVKTFDNSIDAHLFRIELENEGIECFIFDEGIVTANPLYSNAVGGIKVKVRSIDLETVKKVLFANAKNEELICPKCSSQNIVKNQREFKGFLSKFMMLFSFLTITYPLNYKFVYKCNNCGTEFK